MHVEEDSDQELLLGWRSGAAYAAALRMAPSHQQQQTTLPYKQRKATSSSDAGATKMNTKTLDAANGLDKKQRREVVDLGSDSDEDISPSATFKIDGQVDKLRELMPRRSILEKSISLGDGGMVGSISSRTSAPAAVFHISDPPSRQDDASSRAVASTKLDFSAIVYKPGDAGPSSLPACDHLLTSICSSGMRPNITAECPKQLDQTQVVMRKCLQPMDNRVLEESRRRSPGQQVFVDLTRDDDGCDSEPEWLRDHEPAVLRGSRNSEGSGGCSLRVEQCLRPCLPTASTSGENIEVGDGGGDETRLTLSIPGLESLENRRTTSSIRADVESGEENLAAEKAKRKRGRPVITTQAKGTLEDRTNLDNLVSKKSSRAKRGQLSEEELAAQEADKQRKLAAQEAEKQRKREFKEARREEEKRAREEKKEQLKKQKEVVKAQEAERKRIEKENDKWRKGKNALKNTTVHLDGKVLEMKLGSLILQLLSDKEYKYKVGSNPIESTILWKMKRPASDPKTGIEDDGSQPEDVMNSQLTNSQVALVEVEVKYVVVVLEGQEFSRKVAEQTLDAHVSSVRKQYPTYTICYVINGLKKYIKDLVQHHYKVGDGLEPPPVEQALAEFVTHRTGVRSRLCIDEAEIADHIVGLTRSHAEVPFKSCIDEDISSFLQNPVCWRFETGRRQKLTSISVHANGDHVTKSECYKDIIKKNTWLKFLVAIPNIPGATAIAIAKVYPTMRALLDVYFNPFKTNHEKEFLLQDIVKDIPLGSSNAEGRRVGPIASKRIYRVLTAQDGNLRTEDAEDGADHFTREA